MALYQYTLTVPAGTSSSNPIEKKLLIKEDVIYMVTIRIPPGHFANTGLQICYGLDIISPARTEVLYEGTKSDVEEWITGDNEIVYDYPYFELPEKPGYITFKAYNNDQSYDHSFIIRIIALPKWIVFWSKIVSTFVEMLGKIIGL